jgi:hypothetical protein
MEKSDPIIKAYGKGAGLVDDDHGKCQYGQKRN